VKINEIIYFQQFQKLKFDFEAIEINSKPNCSEIQNALGQLTGAQTVPRVFVDGKFIGGGTDVKKLYESGELAKMLNV
jgi:glutaredoxin 3